ncbi:MAG: alkaline phosphatase PhoX, partial [Haloechinothrix sp.]
MTWPPPTTRAPVAAPPHSRSSQEVSVGWSAVSSASTAQFVHEAVAVDPRTGIVYETEDRGTSGFYRFLPAERGNLAAGGR